MSSHALVFRGCQRVLYQRNSCVPEAPRALHPFCDQDGKRLLIVDDAPIIIEIYAARLSRISGIQVLPSKPVTSLGEALGNIHFQSPEIVVTDLGLDRSKPYVLHGLRLLYELREHYPEILVILTTSLYVPPNAPGRSKVPSPEKHIIQILEAAGFDAIFQKGRIDDLAKFVEMTVEPTIH